MLTDSVSMIEMALLVAVCDYMGDGLVHEHDLVNELNTREFMLSGTASSAIAAIEEKMGLTPHSLVTSYPTRGYRVTRVGSEVADGFREVLAFYKTRVRDRIPTDRTRVSVGVPNAVTSFLLAKVMEASKFLQAQDLDIDLDVVEGEPWHLQDLLHKRRIDFAVGPKPKQRTQGISHINICEWKRVLLYSSKIARYEKSFGTLSNTFDPTDTESITFLKSLLQQETVFVPPRNVMTKLDKWLPPPTIGKRVQLPQAAIRRIWVERGLGVAFVHEQDHFAEEDENNIKSLDLSKLIGTTKLFISYLETEKKSDQQVDGRSGNLSEPAKKLVDIIRNYCAPIGSSTESPPDALTKNEP